MFYNTDSPFLQAGFKALRASGATDCSDRLHSIFVRLFYTGLSEEKWNVLLFLCSEEQLLKVDDGEEQEEEDQQEKKEKRTVCSLKIIQ